MRILIAHSFYRLPGGEDRYVRQQVELASRAPHDPHLIAHENEDLTEDGEDRGADDVLAGRTPQGRTCRVRVSDRTSSTFTIRIRRSGRPSTSWRSDEVYRSFATIHNFRLRCPNGLMFTQGRPVPTLRGGQLRERDRPRLLPDPLAGGRLRGRPVDAPVRAELDRKVTIYITPS